MEAPWFAVEAPWFAVEPSRRGGAVVRRGSLPGLPAFWGSPKCSPGIVHTRTNAPRFVVEALFGGFASRASLHFGVPQVFPRDRSLPQIQPLGGGGGPTRIWGPTGLRSSHFQ